MDNFGFIREKVDIKILILFVLRRLPYEVEPTMLAEICRCDDGIDYFDYQDCISELIETDNINENEYGMIITAKGVKNADELESSIPFSVRNSALKKLEPVRREMQRMALIDAGHSTDEDGLCKVHLSMSDGTAEIIEIELLCDNEKTAGRIERNFRHNAEEYYQKFMEMLSADRKRKK